MIPRLSKGCDGIRTSGANSEGLETSRSTIDRGGVCKCAIRAIFKLRKFGRASALDCQWLRSSLIPMHSQRRPPCCSGLGATEVFVFGSATRDALRPGSDIDMAVRGLPPSVYFSAISKAGDLLGRPVDLVDLDDPTPIVRYLLGSGELVRVA